MRLVTFIRDGTPRLGALAERDGREVVVALAAIDSRLPTDMLAFLAGGPDALDQARRAFQRRSAAAEMELTAAQLQAPIPKPGKIICVGLNYRDHAEENNEPLPAYPTIFAKYANSIVGPGAPIRIPSITQKPDYEAELAVVIGRRGRDITEADALRYVAGYVPFNDVSARDYQARTSQWTLGKSFDTFGPLGPALVTADEVPDPHALDIRLSINGEMLQQSNTRNLVFSIPTLIAYLSAAMTLEPGDVIATGTPGGVGGARKPPRFLRPGDVVRVEIERLGTLENPVEAYAVTTGGGPHAGVGVVGQP